jgi:hypothetical protein
MWCSYGVSESGQRVANGQQVNREMPGLKSTQQGAERRPQYAAVLSRRTRHSAASAAPFCAETGLGFRV